MKKIKLLLLLLMLGPATAYSQLQQIKIVSFSVKNQLPPSIDNWGTIPGSLLLVAQLPPNVSVKGIRLIVQIRGGGAIVCGNNSTGGMQVDEFTTRTFSANELTSTLQGCRDLKEGSYSICVQFFNVDRVAISNEVCKEFNVETPKEIEYTPPTLINPENGKVFSEAELSRPVNFRWTPLVPKPRDPVTYRLKVWQLMQGQNSTEAMRSNQPIITKDVDNITQAVVNGIYTGPCRPPYLCDFVWQVQALNREGKPMGKNEGKSDAYTFKVETNSATATPPQLVAPADAKSFSVSEMTAPVIFRWTPVVPKPQSAVTYRLKVWQLLQGQTAAQVMRSNTPIIAKEVENITQAAVSGIYTGPCRPPYLCDFVWQVQALNRENQPVGNNEGKSEAWTFKIQNNIDIQIDSLKVGCCENGKQSIYIKVRNNLATPVNIVAIKYKVNGVGASINLSPTSPVIPQTIAGNAFKVFTATIDCNPAINFLKFLIDAEDVADPDNKETEVKSDTLKCACIVCDEKNFTLNAPAPGNISINNNTITFNQPITVTTIPVKTIKTIKAELVYFEMVPENDMCIPCNKESAAYGHFSNNTNSQEWNGPQQNLNIIITTPQLTPCCSAVFKWCIRYKIEFTDCTTCNKLVCYEKRKEGCENVNPDKNPK